MRRYAVAASAVILIACTAPPAQPEDAAGPAPPAGQLSPTLLAVMDSAASEYRDHDYERAREHYSDATLLDTTLAAPWFGLFLAHRALGNMAAADSAFMTARRLAQRQ